MMNSLSVSSRRQITRTLPVISHALRSYSTPAAQLGFFKVPKIDNEPMLSYAPGSPERQKLKEAISELRSQLPLEIPCVVNGERVKTGNVQEQRIPYEHKTVLARYHTADEATVKQAINGALEAKKRWEEMPWNDRATIFLKAADLLSTKYRYKILAATILGQGKNVWQAEIDAAAELADFWRFGCKYAEELYHQQPPMNPKGMLNRLEYRGLEGFVYAISPFNFTAIGGNLAGAPALMGNTVVHKPSDYAILSQYFVQELLEEAGLPRGVIQFVPGNAVDITRQVLASPDFAALHFTGSTAVFRHLWKEIGSNVDRYRSYPRLVGETGGKNFHLLHPSADVRQAALQTLRGAFEYQGQKCSATSRVYVPDNLWNQFREEILKEHAKIKQGSPEDFTNFLGAVIHKQSFDKISGFINHAKSDSDSEIIAGGNYDDSVGYFVEPTIIHSKNPRSKTMTQEIFGPVLTAYVYPAGEFEETMQLIQDTTGYALTGAVFARDREAIVQATQGLRHAAGNFYVNDKSTGAVVGQQPFGGARASGTNDKAGSGSLLLRFVSMRTIKENFLPLEELTYPSNKPE
ncbi:uncharacterized protein VTP21DRAFT_9302 [Calcarisporiella thermophila]|uniref:uncharacterized protein n=1 Tax=Calcarisporiella thermophila TaxID=911321 RepID=UPI003744926A